MGLWQISENMFRPKVNFSRLKSYKSFVVWEGNKRMGFFARVVVRCFVGKLFAVAVVLCFHLVKGLQKERACRV